MHETSRLSEVVGRLYDAALDPARWNGVLGEARDFVGGMAAAIYAKDAASKTLTVFHEDGQIDPEYQRLYAEEYVRIDPSNIAHFYSTVENPVAGEDMASWDEMAQTRFYQEWVRPQGMVDSISAMIEKSGSAAAMFGIFRGERDGIADEEARRRMQLIAPHVRRAVLIGKAIEFKTAQASSFTEVFDGLCAAMFLVRSNRLIVHANAAGQAMLAESGFLHALHGRLTARTQQANQALADAIAAAGKGDRTFGVRGVALPLAAEGGDCHVAHILPLTSGARREAGLFYAADAAIFVRTTTLDTRSPQEVMARHFRLTPSELRVVLAIADVGGVPETAEALGVSETTVKAHLRATYSKTGAGRQADLVKLVAGFSGPLAA